MRHPVLLAQCLSGTAVLAGCGGGSSDADVQRALKDVNVIDESNLNDIMLTVGDPDERWPISRARWPRIRAG